MRLEDDKLQQRKRTLFFSKVNGIFLVFEGQSSTLHVIRTMCDNDERRFRRGNQAATTHELAQPIKGFSHRPAP